MKLEELLEGVSYRILQKPAGTQEAKESGAADKDIEEKDIVGKDIAEKDIPTIVFDNRKVTEGCLFVCVKGMKYDSHEHVEEIAAAGAKVIVVEQEITLPAYPEVTVLKVASTRYAMAFIAAAWYHHPAEKMKIIGITGTKGKPPQPTW